MTLSQQDIEMLTVEERLELIERVWGSLAMTHDDHSSHELSTGRVRPKDR